MDGWMDSKDMYTDFTMLGLETTKMNRTRSRKRQIQKPKAMGVPKNNSL